MKVEAGLTTRVSELTVGRHDRILVFAPHPDDESLAVGGLLQRAVAAGAFVRVVFWTDGEDNPWAQRCVERRLRLQVGDRVRWGERRRSEVAAALRQLGLGPCEARFWHAPDQGLEQILLEGPEPWLERAVATITSTAPTLLVVPSLRDLHPDHSALAALTRIALDEVRLPTRPRRLEYLVHRAASEPRLDEVRLALNDAEIEGKRAAIRSHASQLPLRSAMMLGFAQRTETFRSSLPVLSREIHHPIEQAVLDRGGLRLEWRRRWRPGLGPTTLRLVWKDARGVSSASVRMPSGAGEVELRDVRGRTIGSATVRRAGRIESVHFLVPFVGARDVRRLFVKVERPWERKLGFFDRAGWREAALIARAETSAEVRAVAASPAGTPTP